MLREAPAGVLGLFRLGAIRFAAVGQVVVIGAAALSALRGAAGSEFETAQLSGHEHGPSPSVVFPLRQHVPDQDRELARHGDSGDVVAAPGAHPFVERPQRARTAHRLPGGFDQKMAGIAPAAPGDPSVMGRPVAGLPDCRTLGLGPREATS